MKKKLGILLLATSMLAFLYLTWELMEVSFGFAYFFETAPPTLGERVIGISLGILWRFILVLLVLILIQYLTFKYLIKSEKTISSLIYFLFITLGTSAMVYGYQVSKYIHSEQSKKLGQSIKSTELPQK